MKSHDKKKTDSSNRSIASSSLNATKSKNALFTELAIGPDVEIVEDKNEIAKAVSFLSADAVRWINKRQPPASNGTAARARVLPAKALQLREIFLGLDFDNSGSIDIDELKEAVEYVAKNASSDGPVLKDPGKLADFFVQMDVNGDGTVDFNEFLIAMTVQEGDDEDEMKTSKLQEAFMEFASYHRRQKILDAVSDPTLSDVDKYNEMKELFKIQYFKEEQLDLSTAEKLLRAKQLAIKQMKEIRTTAYVKQKRVELVRAREAIMYFTDEKKSGQMPSINRPYIPALLDKEVSESEMALAKAERLLRQKFAEFSLPSEKTFTPMATGEKSKSGKENYRRRAKEEAAHVKTEKYLVKNLPPIVPPVSMREKRGSSS